MICTQRPCVSFLEYVIVKVFRDRVFRVLKVLVNKTSERLSKNDLYQETLCFLSVLCICQSISRSSFRAVKVRLKKISKRLSKNDLY